MREPSALASADLIHILCFSLAADPSALSFPLSSISSQQQRESPFFIFLLWYSGSFSSSPWRLYSIQCCGTCCSFLLLFILFASCLQLSLVSSFSSDSRGRSPWLWKTNGMGKSENAESRSVSQSTNELDRNKQHLRKTMLTGNPIIILQQKARCSLHFLLLRSDMRGSIEKQTKRKNLWQNSGKRTQGRWTEFEKYNPTDS